MQINPSSAQELFYHNKTSKAASGACLEQFKDFYNTEDSTACLHPLKDLYSVRYNRLVQHNRTPTIILLC